MLGGNGHGLFRCEQQLFVIIIHKRLHDENSALLV
jgi:hypothetical protein